MSLGFLTTVNLRYRNLSVLFLIFAVAKGMPYLVVPGVGPYIATGFGVGGVTKVAPEGFRMPLTRFSLPHWGPQHLYQPGLALNWCPLTWSHGCGNYVIKNRISG